MTPKLLVSTFPRTVPPAPAGVKPALWAAAHPPQAEEWAERALDWVRVAVQRGGVAKCDPTPYDAVGKPPYITMGPGWGFQAGIDGRTEDRGAMYVGDTLLVAVCTRQDDGQWRTRGVALATVVRT